MAYKNIDTTGYVDLTLDDRDPQTIYSDALSYATWTLPEWVPAETNIENVVMQAMALMVAEGVTAINRLPNAVVEVLLQLHGVTRQTGDYPTVNARFTMIDASGYTVPAGTEALYDLGDGASPIVFVLNSDVVIANGQTYGDGVMTGNLAESRFNNIAANTSFTVVTPLSYLLSVTTTGLITGGVDSETDADYFDRGSLRLGRLTEALVLPTHFESYAVEAMASVYRAKCIDLYDPNTGPTPGDNPGYVTVAVYGNGAPVSTADKAELLTMIQAASLASLTISVIDPEDLNMIGVHCDYVPLLSADPATTTAAISTALAGYLSTSSWAWGTTLRWSNIVGLIENVTGVDYIALLYVSLNVIAWDESTFNEDIANWSNTTNCTLSWESTITNGIGGSMKITPAAAGDVVATSAAAAGANSYPVTAGEVYWVGAKVYTPAAQTVRTVKLTAEWYQSDNTPISTTDGTSVVTEAGAWIELGDWLTAPALAAKVNIAITIASAGGNTELFYVDDVRLSHRQAVNTDVTLVGNAPLVMPAELVVAVD